MSFRAVEMEYRAHAEGIRRRAQQAGRFDMRSSEWRGIAYYLKAAEDVWNLQRERVVSGAGFEMREEIENFGGYR